MADTDFYTKMLDDLPCQFKDKEKIAGLIYALSRQLNAVRDVCDQLNTMRSLRTAAGKQLDGIGNIAVLTRDEAAVLALKSASFTQMTDDIYRLYLIQKIAANMTNCTYADLYNAMVILWGKTPIWYSESIDEPATITMTVPALSSFDETSTFLGLWEIRPAGVQLNFTATANAAITINADFRPSAFIITHIKTGTKPRRAAVLTFDGVIISEAVSGQGFVTSHEKTSESLRSGTKPTKSVILDNNTLAVAGILENEMFGVDFERSGNNPDPALLSGTATVGVYQIIDKEVLGVGFTHSGTEPRQSVQGSGDAAGITTGISPAAYSVKFRKCGTGNTKA